MTTSAICAQELVALESADAEAVAAICPFEGMTAERIRWEIDRPAHHVWLGTRGWDGTVVAAHRGVVWQSHLLLKGLVVNEGQASSTTFLTLALAMRKEARRRGLGVAAWVEPHRPEAHLARRLRLQPASDLVHRYLVPEGGEENKREESQQLSGFVDLNRPCYGPLAGYGAAPGAVGDHPETVSWCMDRDRLLLSSLPDADGEGAAAAASRVAKAAGVTPSQGYEVPLDAADLMNSLQVLRAGGRRLSRTPVYLATSRPGCTS